MEGKTPSGRPSYKIASIPADGIGPEVVSAGIQVLITLVHALNEFDLEFEHFEWGSAYYRKHGKYLPEDALERLKAHNAILFGAVGAPGMCAPCPFERNFEFDMYVKIQGNIGH
jgi:isocitrate/isopropylmalate dehydrogenase